MARFKPVNIKKLVEKVVRDSGFQKRQHSGTLAAAWDELFHKEMGELIRRDGDTIVVKVRGSAHRYELEQFRKAEIIETIQQHPDFSAIQNIRFVES